MPAVPAVPSVVSGVYPSSSVSALVAVQSFLLKPPAAELRQIVAQTLTNSTGGAITFTASDVDQDYLTASNAGHSNSVNTTRYTANFPGWYQLGGVVAFVPNATGRRANWWAVNGSTLNASQCAYAATAASDCEVATRVKQAYLNIGDYVELFGYQESGGNLNTNTTGSASSGVSIKFVSI
jgi:hypothetical protein